MGRWPLIENGGGAERECQCNEAPGRKLRPGETSELSQPRELTLVTDLRLKTQAAGVQGYHLHNSCIYGEPCLSTSCSVRDFVLVVVH
jgi:hypothetical protein